MCLLLYHRDLWILERMTMSLLWTLFTRKIDPFIDPVSLVWRSLSRANIFVTIFTSFWMRLGKANILRVKVKLFASTFSSFSYWFHHALCLLTSLFTMLSAFHDVSFEITINKIARIRICSKLFSHSFFSKRPPSWKFDTQTWFWTETFI